MHLALCNNGPRLAVQQQQLSSYPVCLPFFFSVVYIHTTLSRIAWGRWSRARPHDGIHPATVSCGVLQLQWSPHKSVCPRPFCSVSELVSQPLPVGLWMLGPTQDPAQIGQKCQISPSAIWISNLSGVEFGIVHETDGRSLHVGGMHVGLLLDRRWSTRSVIPEQAEGESSSKSGSKPKNHISDNPLIGRALPLPRPSPTSAPAEQRASVCLRRLVEWGRRIQAHARRDPILLWYTFYILLLNSVPPVRSRIFHLPPIAHQFCGVYGV